MAKKKKGYFSISAVSDMIGIHQQTIRMYEREGLINPKRSDGNTRMFSEDDVELLEKIINYTNKLGVNLAGVEIILKMQKRIDLLQNEMNSIFNASKNELEKEKIDLSGKISLISEELVKIKNEKSAKNLQKVNNSDNNN